MQVNVTDMLTLSSTGDRDALDRLVPVLYDQLKRMAHNCLRNERQGHSLNTTALVHEAYLRLIEIDRVQWRDRAHFYAVAARTMRRVLVDHARARTALKRGGGASREELRDAMLMTEPDAEKLVELNEVLERLEVAHPRSGRALELRYFGGLTLEEAAAVLDVSPPTVMRDVRFAIAWLARAWKAA